MNKLFGLYEEKWLPIENELMKNEKYENKQSTKLKGIVVAGIFREQINRVLSENNLSEKYKLSEMNAYIYGLPTEFDFLLLKNTAKAINISNVPIYLKSDVIVVFESKYNGVFTDDDRKKLVSSFASVTAFEPSIKLGYMTMTELVPKNKIWNEKPTVSHWEKLCYAFSSSDQIKENSYKLFTATTYYNNPYNPYIFNADNEWDDFVLGLVN